MIQTKFNVLILNQTCSTFNVNHALEICEHPSLTLSEENDFTFVRIATILINRGRVHSGHDLLGG